MPVVIQCPTCQRPLTVHEAQVGSVVACPYCRHPLTVPVPAPIIAESEDNESEPFDAMDAPPPEDPTSTHRYKREPSSNGPLIVGGVVGALVLTAVAFAVGWWVFGTSDPRQDAKKADPPAKAAPNLSDAPATKRPSTPVAPNTPEDNATRLRRMDREAMDSFKKGEQRDGFLKLIDAGKPYQQRDPDNCTPDEALAVAVIYSRIASIGGKSLSEDVLLKYTDTIELFSKRGGIRPEARLAWFERILDETLTAYKKK